jgi:hyperosmotically inducible periplasmic protein
MWLPTFVVSWFVITLVATSVPSVASAQVSDMALVERVTQTVQRSANFGIFDDVNVEVSNRAVTLTGRVTTPAKRDAIADRVGKIDGLRALTNDIRVLPNSPLDTRLRAKAAQAIYGHSAFWHYASMANPPIHIIVEHGHITLTGCVNSEVEKTLAYALAQVEGSFGVKNELRIDKR